MKLRYIILLTLCGAPSPVLYGDAFVQTILVSDLPTENAAHVDSNLIDPWGMAFSATSPIWVSDRATGVATLYNGKTGAPVSLVVTVPPGTATTGPTGQVFAGPTTSFTLNGSPASFIFDTLGGTIDAWNGGATATVVATTAGAIYEGLAIANNRLYAANFVPGGGINVFDSSYHPVTLSSTAFTDPSIPAGYAPFNVQTINGNLYVEYAKLSSTTPVPLPGGGGYVDVFDTNGNLIQQIRSAQFDAPWGVTIAPATGFGSFSGDLLIGNFGTGTIGAYNPSTGVFLGTIADIAPGLWALDFGNSSAFPNALYFTDGINRGTDGLFGYIQDVPEPGAFGLGVLGILGLLGYAWQRRSNLLRTYFQ